MINGEDLRRYRKAAGLTQMQLAEQIGCPYQSIQKYEYGERGVESMAPKTFAKLAKALNIDPREALKEDE